MRRAYYRVWRSCVPFNRALLDFACIWHRGPGAAKLLGAAIVDIGQQPAHDKTAVRQAFTDLLDQFQNLAFDQASPRTGSDYWVVEWKMSGTLRRRGPASTST